ncbi:MAG: glycosyltransferase family 2 protein [Alphaproteobacteria bacterium]|nr:glycosyltransferase family 2 protein [Alphaproteobacteria bacterium]
MSPLLTVIVPTLNERPNIRPLLAKLDQALAGVAWEAIFVDDASQDGTPDEVAAVAAERPNVRLIERVGRRGLSSACIEGMLASTAKLVAVIDGDLQHDESILPRMLAAFAADSALDLAIGSRFVPGGGVGEWSAGRLTVSRFASQLGRLVLPVPLADPMSGFFMLRREVARRLAPRLSARGYKILLDLVATAGPGVKLVEIPYTFRDRQAGESKLSSRVVLDYLIMLADRLVGQWVPIRFVLFVAMGMVGLTFHLAVLGLFHVLVGQGFRPAQFIAAGTAMTVNYFLNNAVTYRDQRKQGAALLRGLVVFYLLCSAGLYINLEVAGSAFDKGAAWWFAGTLGALVGALWNFAVNTAFNWRVQA